MMMKTLACLVLCLSSVAFGQIKHPKSPFEVDKIPPPFCNIHLVSLAMVNGSPSYVRLAFIAESLASAQTAAETMKKEIADIKTAKSWAALFEVQAQAADEAVGDLHCAAQIAFRYKPTDKDDENVRLMLIASFNQEAQAVIDLTASEKRRLLRSDPVAKNPQIASKDADELSNIYESQRDAASTILQASTLAILLAIAPSPDGLTTSGLNITCSERSDLLQRVESTSKGTKTAYSQDAGIIKVALTEHHCSDNKAP
jgi:hypothetical protein